MPAARPEADVRAVLELKAAGRTDREISELTGVPIGTIRIWRRRGPSKEVADAIAGRPRCPDCGSEPHDFSQLPSEVYAYLLGAYLGDGHLSRVKRSWVLRVTLDEAYPGIIESCCDAIEALRGRRPSATPRTDSRCVVVSSRWRAWGCLIPQHGPGRKHKRKIELAAWQAELVDADPGAFLRGLVHTDGWRGVNRVIAKGREYSYPRYQFSNRSDDIRGLFTDACDRLGVRWRPWTRYHISVAQRESVALLDEFVGPKT
jgi:hypothetical protein